MTKSTGVFNNTNNGIMAHLLGLQGELAGTESLLV